MLFSRLLLDENETYLEDRGARYFAGPGGRSVAGRLYLSTRSLFFAPSVTHGEGGDAKKQQVVRITLAKISQLGRDGRASPMGHDGGAQDRCVVRCTDTTYMRPLSPYITEAPVTEHVFALDHHSTDAFLLRVGELHRIAKMPDRREANAALAEIITTHRIESLRPFDLSLLVDLDEERLVETMCAWVTPLVKAPVRVVITSKLLYVQPLDNIQHEPVFRFDLSCISTIYRRRHLHKEVGLELLLKKPANTELFLCCHSVAARDELHHVLSHHPIVSMALDSTTHQQTQLRWQHGLLSNYDYLMHLNHLADRTKNDLTQYPVFPWVVADYQSAALDLDSAATFRDLSKPIGALNAERLAMYRERMQQLREAGEKPFLYGTHYSTPGYVLFYLVRARPDLMLRLQSGRFDSPDRAFFSVSATWSSCLSSPGDVKELIPEFFSDESFLVNAKHLDLGTRQNGHVVDDVELPPWAHGSARKFVEVHREALESEWVSQRLHCWIDLVFGYKQQGAEAARSDNLFHPLTYQGAVDIDSVTDPIQRAAMETQVSEFGQTPKQLFVAPHPKRVPRVDWTGDVPSDTPLSSAPMASGGASLETSHGGLASLASSGMRHSLQRKTSEPFRLHRESVTGLCVSDTHFAMVSRDGMLKVNEHANRKQLRATSVGSGAPLSCCQFLSADHILVGSWDSKVYTYSIAFNRSVFELPAHDDAVSSLRLSGDTMITGGTDTLVRLWSARPSGFAPSPLVELADLECPVSSVDLRGSLFVAGGANGNVLFGDVRVPGGLVRCEPAIDDGMGSAACQAVRLMSDGRHAICGTRVLSFSPGDGNVALPLRVATSDAAQLVTCVDTLDSLAYVGLAHGEVQVFDCMGGGARHLDTLRCANTDSTLTALAVGASCVYAGFDNGLCVIIE